MRVAIHQPNFIPHFPFFYKMAMVDIFVILSEVQFEKNGYQNRFKYRDKWITKPVHNGVELLSQKDYIDLDPDPRYFHATGSVKELNMKWIHAIKDTFNIKTILAGDYMNSSKSGTERLIELIKENKGNVYVTNSEAKEKYLDEELMKENGIEIEYCKVPNNLQRSTFEIIEEFGIEGAIRNLPKRRDLCTI